MKILTHTKLLAAPLCFFCVLSSAVLSGEVYYETDFSAPGYELGDLIGQDGWTLGNTGTAGIAEVVEDTLEAPGGSGQLGRTIATGTRVSTMHTLRSGSAEPITEPFTVDIVAAFSGEDPNQRFYIGHGTWGGAAVGFRPGEDGRSASLMYRSTAGFVHLETEPEPDTFYRFVVDVFPGPIDDLEAAPGTFDVTIYDMDGNLLERETDLEARAFFNGETGDGYSYIFEEQWSDQAPVWISSIKATAMGSGGTIIELSSLGWSGVGFGMILWWRLRRRNGG